MLIIFICPWSVDNLIININTSDEVWILLDCIWLGTMHNSLIIQRPNIKIYVVYLDIYSYCSRTFCYHKLRLDQVMSWKCFRPTGILWRNCNPKCLNRYTTQYIILNNGKKDCVKRICRTHIMQTICVFYILLYTYVLLWLSIIQFTHIRRVM